jgi:hypothetical protein
MGSSNFFLTLNLKCRIFVLLCYIILGFQFNSSYTGYKILRIMNFFELSSFQLNRDHLTFHRWLYANMQIFLREYNVYKTIINVRRIILRAWSILLSQELHDANKLKPNQLKSQMWNRSILTKLLFWQLNVYNTQRL